LDVAYVLVACDVKHDTTVFLGDSTHLKFVFRIWYIFFFRIPLFPASAPSWEKNLMEAPFLLSQVCLYWQCDKVHLILFVSLVIIGWSFFCYSTHTHYYAWLVSITVKVVIGQNF